MKQRIFNILMIAFVLVMVSCTPVTGSPTISPIDPLYDANPPILPALILPLNGFVDMHAHPMAHLAFGGKLIHGAPDIGTLMPAIPSGDGCRHYERPASIEEALPDDNVTHGGWGTDNTCGDDLRKAIISGFESENQVNSVHHQGRYPDFNSWPAYNDITHQQMYIDWIFRAHQGGLNVMVALAVNNATLSAAVMGPGDVNGDDVSSANVQIDEMVAMVNRHSDFMAIAKTPTELRDIVLGGRLAVVLGVEIDNIGNFIQNPAVDPNNVTEESKNIVRTELQRLWNQGVRYVFPIHVINNKFGGTAIYDNVFNLSNYHQTGNFWDIGCASPESSITHQFVVEGFDFELAAAKVKIGIDPFRFPPTPPACSGHVNNLGLTPLGRFAIQEMMRMGFIIDVDHMSELAVNQTLDLAEAHQYPINSGHNGPRGANGNENGRTDNQYQRIAALGGMAGLGNGGNATNFVNQYHHVLGLVNGNHLAIGTDANGLFSLPGPDPAAVVVYDDSFPRESTGNRTWDINTNGMANYGLLWDYVRSWLSVGMTEAEQQNFLSTAEGFAQMWERVESAKANVGVDIP